MQSYEICPIKNDFMTFKLICKDFASYKRTQIIQWNGRWFKWN